MHFHASLYSSSLCDAINGLPHCHSCALCLSALGKWDIMKVEPEEITCDAEQVTCEACLRIIHKRVYEALS